MIVLMAPLIRRARAAGAIKTIIIDLKDEFARDYITPALWAHARYEGKYPLATALAPQIGYAAAIPDRTLEELIFEAASSVLADAGLAWREVDGVVIAASDLVDGRVISSMVTAPPAGGYMKDLLAVASSAEHAFVLAYLRLAAGLGDTALVAGWSKCSEAPIPQVERLSLDPFYRRHVGMDGLVAAALQAGAYRDRYRVPDEAAARVVVKNRASGA